jgi:Holliday junction DNA helicase RuvA
MIRRLRGDVVEKLRNQIIIDVHGVGYDVFVTPALLTSLELDQTIILYIAEAIREDGHDLYGFKVASERMMFEYLRKVSGVGPKASLAICGFYSGDELAMIVSTGDETKLSLIPGVGKKTASKIILELKDKVTATTYVKTDADVVDALMSLGYTPAEITQLLIKMPNNLASTAERVTWALRYLAN